MSSLVERLRVRSEKRPLYTLDESDDDDFVVSRSSKGKQSAEKSKQVDKSKQAEKSKPAEQPEPAEKIVREDAKEDACQSCGEGGDLVSCNTCTYAYHKKCLYPVSRAALSDRWSCPECVSPLTEIEKILDWEMRTVAEESESSKPSPKKASVKHYLVKWKGLSYLHCTWVPEKEFIKASRDYPRLKSRINNFHKQMESNNNSEDDWVPIRSEWTTVDRILAKRKKGDELEYFVKWRELSYDECTWEVETDISAFKPQIERYNLIQSRGCEKSSTKSKNANREVKELKHKQKEFQHCDHSPEFLTGGKLHPYQLEGLNFLRYSWSKNTHVILADEMGLGKTIQSIAFLASLFVEKLSPHLVIAPLSTLRNWEREFAMWAPQLNVVMYVGSSQSREIIKQYEFYFPKQKTNKMKKRKTVQGDNQKKQRKIRFDVLLTSYEMINMDSNTLKQIQWECMIVDEGHRLKNKDSKLFNQLKLFSTKHRVLLTGTPLQNNLDELFMLMHFLDAGKFASIEDFQKEFKDINQEEQVARLHKMLAPHLLRRVKKDVMKDLPPKKELILRVELSSKQKEYYKAILTRNYQILARRGGAQISLINVVMELRKLCCHAYMLEGVEPAMELTDAEGLRQFLDASGKLHLLDKMMVKLKEQGHRVLIYSQFQHMLDLLEDYLSYKKWAYERIDGKVSGAERQIRIDRFNAKNSTRFCFLLSTRAGGLGINLATADTVIIYDSDWNPHADLQAMARAHRLGQTSKVMIYRLITRGTIEERMMQMTKKKMILEHLVVGRLKAQTVNQEELDDIIRYGSKELFVDESDEAKARQIHYDDAAIDRLLNRDHANGEEASVAEEDDDFLKAFKVANFAYIDEVEAEAAAEEELKKQPSSGRASSSNAERTNYWDELLRDKYEVQHIDELTTMGKGKRSRKQMAATDEDNIDISSEDEDYSYEDELSDNEASVPGNPSGRRAQFSKKRMRDHSEPHPLMEGEGRSLKVLGFNQNQRSLFQQLIMRFGFQDYTWNEFAPRFKGKSWEEVHEYGKLFMQHVRDPLTDLPTFSDGVPKEGARTDDIMIRVGHIKLIEEKVRFMSSNPGINMFPEDILLQFPSLSGRFWKGEQDLMLLKAILKHGYARWQSIIEDVSTGIVDYARKELNLPSVPFAESVQTNETSSSAHPNGTTEANQFRELQRRLVEFIRKRYYLLEKALDLDYGLQTIRGQYDDTSENQQPDQNVPEANNPDPSKANNPDPSETNIPDPSEANIPDPSGANNPDPSEVNKLLRQLPDLEHISIEELADNKDERLKMACLYNEMCKVLEGNALDSVQAYLGDRSASLKLRTKLHQLETLNEKIQQLIAEQGQSTVAEGPKRNVVADGASVNCSLDPRTTP